MPHIRRRRHCVERDRGYAVQIIERNRARTYFQAYAAAAALHFLDKAFEELNAGRTRSWEPFTVPDEGIGCGFTEAVRGVLSHHMVIRDGKIASFHQYLDSARLQDIMGRR